MTNLERRKLFKYLDEMITIKLEALRDRIYKETENVPDEELEEFIRRLRISAVFCDDTEVYLELQAELGRLLNRIQNGRGLGDPMRSADIMKKLGIR